MARAQTTGGDDAHSGIHSLQGSNRCWAIHERHHHVREYNCDLILLVCIKSERLSTIAGCQHGVSKSFKRAARDLANRFLVVNHQDQLAMTKWKIALRGGCVQRIGCIKCGNIQCELTTLMQFAVDVDKASVALHDRQRRRKPETSSLRHFFCSEEGFED